MAVPVPEAVAQSLGLCRLPRSAVWDVLQQLGAGAPLWQPGWDKLMRGRGQLWVAGCLRRTCPSQ